MFTRLRYRDGQVQEPSRLFCCCALPRLAFSLGLRLRRFNLLVEFAPFLFRELGCAVVPLFRNAKPPGAERTAVFEEHIPAVLPAWLIAGAAEAMNGAVRDDLPGARIDASCTHGVNEFSAHRAPRFRRFRSARECQRRA